MSLIDEIRLAQRDAGEQACIRNLEQLGLIPKAPPIVTISLAELEALRADLTEAASTLRRYETLHRAKGTAESSEKADVNAALAARFEATIAKP